MSNQTLRERFRLSESSTNTVSQIITVAMGAGLVKLKPMLFWNVELRYLDQECGQIYTELDLVGSKKSSAAGNDRKGNEIR